MKRLLVLVLAAALLVNGVGGFVLATDGDSGTERTDSPIERILQEAKLAGFDREYKKYFNAGTVTEVVSDSNWDIWSNTNVTVGLSSTTGSDNFYGWVYAGPDGEAQTLYGEGEFDFSNFLNVKIPEDYSFTVKAEVRDGNKGNATIRVILGD
ncbi:MAG: hypothetical protein LBC38_04530 [Oscillospiraceae bacterium]|jgi:hypothetical protein|nr:hypothetical protein [Oscillospiraceae bacterium]